MVIDFRCRCHPAPNRCRRSVSILKSREMCRHDYTAGSPLPPPPRTTTKTTTATAVVPSRSSPPPVLSLSTFMPSSPGALLSRAPFSPSALLLFCPPLPLSLALSAPRPSCQGAVTFLPSPVRVFLTDEGARARLPGPRGGGGGAGDVYRKLAAQVGHPRCCSILTLFSLGARRVRVGGVMLAHPPGWAPLGSLGSHLFEDATQTRSHGLPLVARGRRGPTLNCVVCFLTLPLRIKQVFGKEQGGITDAERTRAKVACLGIIYGRSALMLLVSLFATAVVSMLLLGITLSRLLRSIVLRKRGSQPCRNSNSLRRPSSPVRAVSVSPIKAPFPNLAWLCTTNRPSVVLVPPMLPPTRARLRTRKPQAWAPRKWPRTWRSQRVRWDRQPAEGASVSRKSWARCLEGAGLSFAMKTYRQSSWCSHARACRGNTVARISIGTPMGPLGPRFGWSWTVRQARASSCANVSRTFFGMRPIPFRSTFVIQRFT